MEEAGHETASLFMAQQLWQQGRGDVHIVAGTADQSGQETVRLKLKYILHCQEKVKTTNKLVWNVGKS